MQFQRLDVSGVSVGARNTLASVISALLFASGWWIMIDAAICYGPNSLPHATHAIGSIATIGFIFLNLLPQNIVSPFCFRLTRISFHVL